LRSRCVFGELGQLGFGGLAGRYGLVDFGLNPNGLFDFFGDAFLDALG
jgi:hypothetical protein